MMNSASFSSCSAAKKFRFMSSIRAPVRNAELTRSRDDALGVEGSQLDLEPFTRHQPANSCAAGSERYADGYSKIRLDGDGDRVERIVGTSRTRGRALREDERD